MNERLSGPLNVCSVCDNLVMSHWNKRERERERAEELQVLPSGRAVHLGHVGLVHGREMTSINTEHQLPPSNEADPLHTADLFCCECQEVERSNREAVWLEVQ